MNKIKKLNLKVKSLNYFRPVYISAVYIALTINIFAEEVKTTGKIQDISETGKLVNRRVLILDFVNTNDAAEYGYLETSIPDAFLAPLDKTKSFELMSRSIWQEMLKTKKVQKKDAYVENIAIQTGKNQTADVVVMGSFAVSKNSIIINTHAIEVSSGRTMVSNTKVSTLDGTIFTAITALAKEMSADMKEKLPPLPQQVITEERIKFIDKKDENNIKIEKLKSRIADLEEKLKYKTIQDPGKPDFAKVSKPADKKFAVFFDPVMTVFGMDAVQVEIPVNSWNHLNINASYFNLSAWKPTIGINAIGFYLGASYRFMLAAFNKDIGRTSLNGLFVAPTFQFLNGTAYDQYSSSKVSAYSLGAEVGHQWLFQNGFILGIRIGYLFTLLNPPGAIPSTYLLYMIPFNVGGPVIHFDIGYAF